MIEEIEFNILVECKKCETNWLIPEYEIPDTHYCTNADCDGTKFIFYKKIKEDL